MPLSCSSVVGTTNSLHIKGGIKIEFVGVKFELIGVWIPMWTFCAPQNWRPARVLVEWDQRFTLIRTLRI